MRWPHSPHAPRGPQAVCREGQSETRANGQAPLGAARRALQAAVQLANRSGPLNDIGFPNSW